MSEDESRSDDRRHNPSEIRAAVSLVVSGVGQRETARRLGIGPRSVHHWMKLRRRELAKGNDWPFADPFAWPRKPKADPVQRFWSKVDRSGDGCWLWIGGLDVHGYGMFRLDGRLLKSHRHSYELLVGLIPDGLTIDHLCRVPRCVNPAHLEPVTQSENSRRLIQALGIGITCKRGHSLADAYVSHLKSGRVSRQCRTCRHAYDNARYQAKKKVA